MKFLRKYLILQNGMITAYYSWRKDAEEEADRLRKKHPYSTIDVYVKLDKGVSVDKAREQS